MQPENKPEKFSQCRYFWVFRTLENPRALYQDICKFYLPSLPITKSYPHCPSPEEHNLIGLQNCNVISCIVFNKTLTIIYTISKNSSSTRFCTQRGSALYLVSHRMIISTNIHLLWPVFTIQSYTGFKVKNILSRFLPATKWKKKVANTMFFTDLSVSVSSLVKLVALKQIIQAGSIVLP